ncbi:undecaprenyldiphospho-muramoylpentapeptide beta-N-acetylglucosaminyltransferase [Marinimicrococcus flavescens]|uniref:UDP-N-acetylglucosamine--N-acetylmuramyl-(pentapeptide) pyrophosphoryl-undecaprenol N-acetylglucosamine transferase n=1 Tax=Marinimicrococcus flavescens TaxID=3031815 RepID=A0AAP3XT28_9PROT|nr:undecaprenyldiphospho-muramoylpentapeptide beta-N-acetylglucosaminyltransferase [Marinimicrococcus flavescens]
MAGHIVLAAGGTGGHMFPALAVAAALEARGWAVTVLTDARGARYVGLGTEHRLVDAASPAGGFKAKLAAGVKLGRGTLQSLAAFRELRPRAAAAFGGYACVPAALAAAMTRTPLLLHEQNAVFGRANRALGRMAHRVALSFEPTSAVPPALRGLALLTGNPVRPGFEVEAPARQAGEGDALRLLVLGGSQGAKVFSDVLPAALQGLPEALRARLVVAQQCRPEDLDRVRDLYAGMGQKVELASFFEDVPARMAAADLVVSRSGASTIAELLMLGRPSLLVPYQHAADDHQTANARALAEEGAALLVPQPEAVPERLTAALAELVDAPGRLRSMAAAARRLARPDAAERIADTLIEIARPDKRR